MGDLTAEERATNIKLLVDAGASTMAVDEDDHQGQPQTAGGGEGLFSEDDNNSDDSDTDDQEDADMQVAIKLQNEQVPAALRVRDTFCVHEQVPAALRVRDTFCVHEQVPAALRVRDTFCVYVHVCTVLFTLEPAKCMDATLLPQGCCDFCAFVFIAHIELMHPLLLCMVWQFESPGRKATFAGGVTSRLRTRKKKQPAEKR